ncbi:NlpC/P60 family protein [Cryobacterium sp. TMT2-18-3]|uniref:C40 family peptidase n=1 Tax=unclassified Cryobacterium TaxID=2649013 RepID=UPI001069226E|nr:MULTISPECIES: C40 family peptidase [unclassified Cryobacterium]TFC30961.1 NlpC/P60 family protein [Cryobacterium sp. TMT2-18-2]TFC34402.1 NlpC/P60 family protein [Cryobacterium sp. TMT2-42-4]TFC63364.1 NlpC/P60 family protein [Cryobacterium sp. TMT2-18-3]
MTMIAAMSRVSEIQATLVQLSAGANAHKAQATAAAGSTTAGAGASTSANTFADALASASGAAAVRPVAPNPGGATGTDVVDAAKKYLGVPYVFGGEDASGMDCSGLVQTVYAEMGIDVPRLVSGQMTIGTEVGSLAEAKPGDLIVTGGGEHILIYAGDNKVIHAPYEGRTVSLVEAYMDDSEIDTIRRVIPDAPAATASLASSSTASASSGAGSQLSAALASFMNGASR